MEGVHYVLHAPQGDTYADLLFTMIERRAKRPPVTYTTFQARDLGGDTAELFKTAAREAYERFQPQALLVGASCTAELIQDDPGGLAGRSDCRCRSSRSSCPPTSGRRTGARPRPSTSSFARLLDLQRRHPARSVRRGIGRATRCNLLGPTALGFRHRDDLREVTALLARLGVDVNVVAPMGATPADLARLGEADFNVVLYPEIAAQAAQLAQRTFGQPAVKTVPIGVGATREFVEEVARLAGVDPAPALSDLASRSPWYAKSVDSTYLTGKRVFVFGERRRTRRRACR